MAEALTPAQQLKNTLESLKVSNGKERDDMLTVFVDYYLSQTFVLKKRKAESEPSTSSSSSSSSSTSSSSIAASSSSSSFLVTAVPAPAGSGEGDGDNGDDEPPLERLVRLVCTQVSRHRQSTSVREKSRRRYKSFLLLIVAVRAIAENFKFKKISRMQSSSSAACVEGPDEWTPVGFLTYVFGMIVNTSARILKKSLRETKKCMYSAVERSLASEPGKRPQGIAAKVINTHMRDHVWEPLMHLLISFGKSLSPRSYNLIFYRYREVLSAALLMNRRETAYYLPLLNSRKAMENRLDKREIQAAEQCTVSDGRIIRKGAIIEVWSSAAKWVAHEVLHVVRYGRRDGLIKQIQTKEVFPVATSGYPHAVAVEGNGDARKFTFSLDEQGRVLGLPRKTRIRVYNPKTAKGASASLDFRMVLGHMDDMGLLHVVSDPRNDNKDTLVLGRIGDGSDAQRSNLDLSGFMNFCLVALINLTDYHLVKSELAAVNLQAISQSDSEGVVIEHVKPYFREMELQLVQFAQEKGWEIILVDGGDMKWDWIISGSKRAIAVDPNSTYSHMHNGTIFQLRMYDQSLGSSRAMMPDFLLIPNMTAAARNWVAEKGDKRTQRYLGVKNPCISHRENTGLKMTIHESSPRTNNALLSPTLQRC